MYLAEGQKYEHFKEVFDTIRERSIVKNYYDANLFNIEDILSILEMSEYLEDRRLKEVFLTYIKDVIAFYTPELKPHEDGQIPGNWADWLFGENDRWKPYGLFIAGVLNLRFALANPPGYRFRYEDLLCQPAAHPTDTYSLVTLNYDLIPEIICTHLNRFTTTSTIDFNGSDSVLAKLHGSIDSAVIVPPTWSKGVNTDIVPAWKTAYQALADATQLRIIGYSLATADAYVKYLLKSAIIREPRLKKVDVICKDSDGSVRTRYSDFIKFDFFRFANADAGDYLEANARRRPNTGPGGSLIFDTLEEAHEAFMNARPPS
jgi:hypothetical protein